jgi:hypothetical protein
MISAGQNVEAIVNPEKQERAGISFFEKYLTLWVILCMAAGILIGRYFPGIPDFLNRFEYARVSMPISTGFHQTHEFHTGDKHEKSTDSLYR